MATGHEDFQTVAVMRGVYAGAQITLAVDSLGRIQIRRINQSDIAVDTTEATTWDAPPTTFLHNLNRIRHELVTITGEAWGTVSHSIATVWAKFSPTTGHAHSGAANDGKPIDHGTNTGLGDYDHDQYVRKNLSQAITGALFKRDVDTDLIQVHGGTGAAGTGADIRFYGKNHPTMPGRIYMSVPNAAGNNPVNVLEIDGMTDTPVWDFQARQLKNLLNPTAAQDAATKNYVDTADLLRLLLAGGTMAGAIAMATYKITGLGDPTAAQDAATKNYHDSDTTLFKCNGSRAMTGAYLYRSIDTSFFQARGGIHDAGHGATAVMYGKDHASYPGRFSVYVPAASGLSDVLAFYIDGVTNTPVINFNSRQVSGVKDPISAQDAATKNYVDTADALRLLLAGGTMAGAIAMGTNKITYMGDPLTSQDAATKNYVDAVCAAWMSYTATLTWGSPAPTGVTQTCYYARVGHVIFILFKVYAADGNGTPSLVISIPTASASPGPESLLAGLEKRGAGGVLLDDPYGLIDNGADHIDFLEWHTPPSGNELFVWLSGKYAIP